MITKFYLLKKVIATTLSVALFAPFAYTQAATTLTLAHAHPVDDSQHLAALRFAERVKERSGDEINIRIFPNGQLGNDQAMITGVRSGTIDIELSGNPYFSGLASQLSLLDLPFLFDNYDQAYRVLDGEIGLNLLTSMREKNLEGLAFWEIGFRNLINSRRAIESANDIKGLKLRTTPNPVHIAAFEALGANPVPMPFAELFTALETRTVDGQENPVSLIRSASLYDVQKHLSLTAHAYTAAPLVMNKNRFSELSEEQQLILRDEAQSAAQYQRQINQERISSDLEFLKNKGMQVAEQPDRASMHGRVAELVRNEFTAQHGSELLDAVERTKYTN
ncbi:TRAP-type C4-dicarboxylate transport system, periplasmic component [Halomonas citrativorans]|uniref:TRAP-type C4-dicarboxylate transport system, periplasmic component n=1 Tax=Halomonas citrativorans TaxID=2742612 RepID=A0A1R4I4F1_9GAMM|nr:TRAP transporter substrate-binding protein [Halomonas citrativorans]SJN14771.1 TRAP-type C4-dicarboxylate transport system, periplasmic component [Halomonas citrativorans]